MNNPRCGLCGISTGRHWARLLFPRGCGKAPPTRWTSRAVFSLCPRLPAGHPVSKSLACHDLRRSVPLPLRSPPHSDHAGPSLTEHSQPLPTSGPLRSCSLCLDRPPNAVSAPRQPETTMHNAPPPHCAPPPSHTESLRACLSTPTQLHHASPTPGTAPGPA